MTDPATLAATIRNRLYNRDARDAWRALDDLLARCERAETALRDTAVYIAICKASRHGLPAGDNCPRCRSDQRELDRIGAVLAGDAQPATLDVSYRERRLAEKMLDPEFRKAYEDAQPDACTCSTVMTTEGVKITQEQCPVHAQPAAAQEPQP